MIFANFAFSEKIKRECSGYSSTTFTHITYLIFELRMISVDIHSLTQDQSAQKYCQLIN